jgi:hypothetical protein
VQFLVENLLFLKYTSKVNILLFSATNILQHARMEKLAENDLTYFYLRHVVIIVTAVTTISLMPVLDGMPLDVSVL